MISILHIRAHTEYQTIWPALYLILTNVLIPNLAVRFYDMHVYQCNIDIILLIIFYNVNLTYTVWVGVNTTAATGI